MRAPLPCLVALAAAMSAGAGTIVDRVVAVVDGHAITRLELSRAMLTKAIDRDPGESDASYEQRVLSEMIDEYLRYQDAARFAPAPPSASEVKAAYERLRRRIEKSGRSPDAEFAAANMTPEQVRSALTRQLVVEQYIRDRFSSIAAASPEEVEREYRGAFSEAYRKAGKSPPPLSAVEAQLREEIAGRKLSAEIDRWTRELREKARITYVAPVPPPAGRTPVVVSREPSGR